jgi:cytochrome c-type biogenesis protein CcmH/NrfG
MHLSRQSLYRHLSRALLIFLFFVVGSAGPAPAFAADDRLAAAVEAARKTHNEAQLESVKAQLEQTISQNPNDSASCYDLARVHAYLADVFEMRKDKKAASAAVEKAIEAVQHSIQLNDKSADSHSLLADLYGRKISLGNGMFAGPKFGPKVKEENAKAMSLDDKNPRVWASLGRQYLMAPKMVGGDVSKAIESLQKSLALDPAQDETWVWLAKAFAKHGEKPQAHDAIGHALSLNPDSAWIKEAANSLN